jgi:hypothetical protein
VTEVAAVLDRQELRVKAGELTHWFPTLRHSTCSEPGKRRGGAGR